MHTFNYKGFEGLIRYEDHEKEYSGQILEIEDYCDYIGLKSIEEPEILFHEAVDDYLIFCEQSKQKKVVRKGQLQTPTL